MSQGNPLKTGACEVGGGVLLLGLLTAISLGIGAANLSKYKLTRDTNDLAWGAGGIVAGIVFLALTIMFYCSPSIG